MPELEGINSCGIFAMCLFRADQTVVQGEADRKISDQSLSWHRANTGQIDQSGGEALMPISRATRSAGFMSLRK